MTTRKLSTDIRQEQIIEAALKVMGDNSNKRLHIKDIAQQLDMAPSALYRHFKNRDAMLSAILEFIRTKLYKNLEAVRQANDDTVKRLRDLLARHIGLIKDEHGIPRILFSDELWGQKQERRQKMYRIVTGYLAEIEDIVREGQSGDVIRKDIKAKAVARMFFGIVQPAALLWHMSEGRFDIDEHVALSWSVFAEIITP